MKPAADNLPFDATFTARSLAGWLANWEQLQVRPRRCLCCSCASDSLGKRLGAVMSETAAYLCVCLRAQVYSAVHKCTQKPASAQCAQPTTRINNTSGAIVRATQRDDY